MRGRGRATRKPGDRAAQSRAARRRGVTLIELMIVITIMLMVTAAAIPIMMPAVQNRQMRESTRILSSYISSARSRAIENGRPVGVMFERFNGQPFSMVVSSVEVPPPYGGDTTNSKVQVSNFDSLGFIGPIDALGTPGTPDTQWNGLLRWGDQITLNYKSQRYFLVSQTSVQPQLDPKFGMAITAAPWFLVDYLGRAPGTLPLPALPASFATTGAPFQIFRQPIRSSAPPIQLPEGVVVDLFSSGVGIGAAFGVPGPLTYNPYFTFTPGGAVDYVGIPGPTRPTGPLYFLVGRRELMPDANGGGMNDLNVYDASAVPKNPQLLNFWVTVDYQTGHVSVTENALTATYAPAAARAFAQTRQSVGGR